MSYDDGYEKIEVDEEFFTEARRIIVDGFMLEGEFNFRERIIKILEEEVKSCEPDSSNEDWADGIRYSIHLIKNIKSEIGSK